MFLPDDSDFELQFTPTLLQIRLPENKHSFSLAKFFRPFPSHLIQTPLAEPKHVSFVATVPEFWIIILISPFSTLCSFYTFIMILTTLLVT